MNILIRQKANFIQQFCYYTFGQDLGYRFFIYLIKALTIKIKIHFYSVLRLSNDLINNALKSL